MCVGFCVCVCVCVCGGCVFRRARFARARTGQEPRVTAACLTCVFVCVYVCVCVHAGGLASRVHELVKGLESRPPVLQKEIDEALKSGRLPVFNAGLNLEFENVSGAYVRATRI